MLGHAAYAAKPFKRHMYTATPAAPLSFFVIKRGVQVLILPWINWIKNTFPTYNRQAL